MRNRRALAVLAAGAWCCCLAPAQTLRDDLAARYRGFEHAIQTHDQKFLDGFLSSGFVAELPNGQTANKAATLKAFNDLTGTVSNIHWTFKLAKPSLSATGAVVEVEGSMWGTVIGQDKKKHKVRLHGSTEDTWIMQGNQWVQSRVKFLKLDATLDGKAAPLPGVAAPPGMQKP